MDVEIGDIVTIQKRSIFKKNRKRLKGLIINIENEGYDDWLNMPDDDYYYSIQLEENGETIKIQDRRDQSIFSKYVFTISNQ